MRDTETFNELAYLLTHFLESYSQFTGSLKHQKKVYVHVNL